MFLITNNYVLAKLMKKFNKFVPLQVFMNKDLLFSTTSELVRVPCASVVFITADGNYSTVLTADGSEYVLTLQLGQIEKRIAERLDPPDRRFIRIGKSLIVNQDFITLVNPSRQRLILSDCKSFRHEVTASREALKALKDYIEEEDA